MIEIEESYTKKVLIFSAPNHEYGKIDIRYLNQRDEPIIM
jgi:ribonuclease E